jgi:hypothetical protein
VLVPTDDDDCVATVGGDALSVPLDLSPDPVSAGDTADVCGVGLTEDAVGGGASPGLRVEGGASSGCCSAMGGVGGIAPCVRFIGGTGVTTGTLPVGFRMELSSALRIRSVPKGKKTQHIRLQWILEDRCWASARA